MLISRINWSEKKIWHIIIIDRDRNVKKAQAHPKELGTVLVSLSFLKAIYLEH
jgi:hypothetical protein